MNLGDKVVKHMRKMAIGCRWRVLHEICYTKSDGSRVYLVPGVWYTGIPYTQGKHRRRYSLFRFKMNLIGGVFFVRKALVGCDCSSAASFAWKKVNPQMPLLNTRKIFKDLCGPETFFSSEQRYRIEQECSSTKDVLEINTTEVMCCGFRALKKGDGLLQYDGAQKKGHVMIVSQCKDDETIMIIDQKGFGKDGSERDDTSWRVDYPYSYSQLIEEGYIPFYLKNR